MATKPASENSAVKQILKETIEVQLAGLKAGVAFWTEWVNQASKFTEAATKGLLDISQEPKDSSRVLSELSDAGREYLRTLGDLPSVATETFKKEIDVISKARKKKSGAPAPKAKRTRAARAKN